MVDKMPDRRQNFQSTACGKNESRLVEKTKQMMNILKSRRDDW
jgi:hypothetical protein